MASITGVRFRGTGKIYYFSPGDRDLKIGDQVLVETARGRELGEIRMNPRQIPDDKIRHPVREIIRKATEDDLARQEQNREKEKEAFAICKKKIREHGLEMKLVDAEYTFENSKLLFYFTAEERVDFRSLVRDLASVFHTRIELRQIGVRDETRIMGGIGPCGRELCCKSWLTDFVPVSIKMAKEQSLSLNPGKISGLCGRLMCCLKNEEDTYEYLNAKMPRVGDIVTIPDGQEGYVQNINVLRQTARVVVENADEKDIAEYPAEELTFVAHRGRRKPGSRADRDRTEGRENREQRGNRGQAGRGSAEDRQAKRILQESSEKQESDSREQRSFSDQDRRENHAKEGRRGRGNRPERNDRMREGAGTGRRRNQNPDGGYSRGDRRSGQEKAYPDRGGQKRERTGGAGPKRYDESARGSRDPGGTNRPSANGGYSRSTYRRRQESGDEE